MKEEKQPILCFAFPAWDGDYLKSTVQLMQEMALKRPVLYANYQYTLKDLVFSLFGKQKLDAFRILGIKTRIEKRVQKNGSIVNLLHLPPVIPANWIKKRGIYYLIQNINALLLSRTINKSLKKLGMQKPVMVNAFNPFFGLFLLDKIEVSKTLYYCYDQIAAANWASRHGAILEKEFIKKIDAVVCSSKALFDQKSKLNKNTFLLKNGVDYELFHQAVSLKKPSKNKTIGYIGTLDSRIDVKLLKALSEYFSKERILIVGRVLDQNLQNELSSCKNIELAGPQPPEKLAQWMSEFDAGIIPFVQNDFTKSIYPLKINEYLAAGLPVISTQFSDLSDFDEIIFSAGNHQDFIKFTEKALYQDKEENKTKRFQTAKANSWSGRAEDLNNIITKIQSHESITA